MSKGGTKRQSKGKGAKKGGQWGDNHGRRRVGVYFDSAEEVETLKEQAEREGHKNFSRWLVERIRLGVSGERYAPEMVERLRNEADVANQRLADAQKQIGELRNEIDALHNKLAEQADEYLATLRELKEAGFTPSKRKG